jgi:hypothetical protein
MAETARFGNVFGRYTREVVPRLRRVVLFFSGGQEMPISTVVQRGSFVQVYDHRGIPLFSRSGELHGYSGGTVSVRRGRVVHTFDERGRQISTRTQSTKAGVFG